MKQSLGKGTVYLMLAELVALVSSYALQVWIAHYLGAGAYGIFGVITSLYLINRAFLNTGIPQATSKFLAEAKENVSSILTASFRFQLWAGFFFALIYILFAKVIAYFLHDTTLTYYIMLLGVMVIPFSLLSLYSTGFMNGLHLFKEQARIKMIYPFLQTVFTFILILLGFEIWGVIIGYFLAILVGLYLSSRYIFVEKKISDVLFHRLFFSKLFKFALPISLASLCFTLLKNVNTLFVKSMLVDNSVVGLFTAAATLSSVPFSVFGAVPIALLPAISRSIAENNIIKVKEYIFKSIRYSLLVLMPLSAIVAASSSQILTFLYSAQYQSADLTLSILIFASTFLALFTCLNAVLVASGRPLLQLITVSSTLVILILLNLLLLPRYGIVGSALASLFSSLFAILVDSFHIYRKLGHFVDYYSLFRILFGSVGLFIIVHYWHYSGWLIIPFTSFMFILYFIFLFLVGEITVGDWLFVKKTFLKKSPPEILI